MNNVDFLNSVYSARAIKQKFKMKETTGEYYSFNYHIVYYDKAVHSEFLELLL